MTKIFKFLFASSLPAGFIFAGSGLLWLYQFRLAEGGFYERLINYESTWIGSHFVLTLSAIMVFPAALVIYQMVKGTRGEILAGLAAIMALLGGFFLSGQYAIDFVMPLVAKAGGEAYTVHQNLFTDPIVNMMFYTLQDLASLSLLLATVALAISKTIDLKYAGLLLGLFLLVIVGSAMDIPLLARPAFIVLGLAFVPVAKRVYEKIV